MSAQRIPRSRVTIQNPAQPGEGYKMPNLSKTSPKRKRDQYSRDRVHVHRFLRDHWEEAMEMIKLHKTFRKLSSSNDRLTFSKLPLTAPPGTMRTIVEADAEA